MINQQNNEDKKMNTKLIELIKEEFSKRLEAKTGWGRNEIMKAFNESITAVLLKLLDAPEKD
jgi:hypothetical protein